MILESSIIVDPTFCPDSIGSCLKNPTFTASYWVMLRRNFLIWFSRAVYTACGLTVVATTSRCLSAPMSRAAPGGEPIKQRIARLNSLPIGVPKLLPVEGTQTNAWIQEPAQVVGNVWVTRLSDNSTRPEETQLSVFNASCPHNGCPIQKAIESAGYVCHCHGARFKKDGNLEPNAEDFTNPSPRGMDPLEHAVVQDSTGQWWVEIVYQSFEAGLTERIAKA